MMNDKEIHHYNEIVDFIENADTICKEDNKWFAIGYLHAIGTIDGKLTPNEKYNIINLLVQNDII